MSISIDLSKIGDKKPIEKRLKCGCRILIVKESKPFKSTTQTIVRCKKHLKP